MTKKIAFLYCFAVAACVFGQSFELIRGSVDSGGVMRSTGGPFELSATIGQPDAGEQVGANLSLSGGFWFAVAPADCDEDGMVGLFDYFMLASCLVGPEGGLVPGCECFDVDRGGSVDLRDFAAAQRAYGNR